MPGHRRFGAGWALAGTLFFAALPAARLAAAHDPPRPEDPVADPSPAVILTDPPPLIAGPDTSSPPPDTPPPASPDPDAALDLPWEEPEVDDPGDDEGAPAEETGLHDYAPPAPEGSLPEPVSPDRPATEPAATDAPASLGRDEFRHLATTEPEALGALSIGTPDGGLLFNPVAMPEGDLWTVRDPRESFGTAETVEYIVAAIASVESRYPGSPKIVIGDISRSDGGRLNRHRSHQAGRDADIGLYLRTGEAKTLVKPGKNQLDLPRTWALLRAFITDTDVERVFLDRSLQRVLYAHALATGEDKAWLDDIFGRKDGGKNAIIQHERRHQDHMHVRFYNPSAQEKGRVAYPVLVQAGLLPGPTVVHRVRSGETLSHLARRYGTSTASIKKANGLRGTTLRAGRKYVIPVRKAPVEAAAVIVPPRRLPPDATVATAPAEPVGDEALPAEEERPLPSEPAPGAPGPLETGPPLIGADLDRPPPRG